MLLDAIGVNIENNDRPELFVISQNTAMADKCREIVSVLRKNGIAADTDNTGRSLKAQFRYAKLGAEFVVVIGDNEAATGAVTVKKLADGSSEETTIDNLVNYILERR